MSRKHIYCLTLGLALVAIATLLFRDQRATSAARSQVDESLVAAAKLGLGTGCPFGGDISPAEIVINLSDFINSRSGLALPQAVKDRLVTLEYQTMYEGRPRLTMTALSTVFSNTWLERVGQLTDQEIYQIGEATRTAIDMPFDSSPGVMLRGSGQLTFDNIAKWMSQATAYRDAGTPEALAARSATPGAIYNALDERLQIYEAALQNQWNHATGFTPVQAFLLGYSIVTDDWLLRSQFGLTKQMQALETAIRQNFPNCETSSANRKPYGHMGYLFSAHTPYLFSEAVQNRLIDRL